MKIINKLLIAFALLGIAAVALPSESLAYSFARDLTIGSTGADVVELQTFLVEKGQLIMPVGVPMGYFGAITQGALGRYQASVGISPTAGYFGPLTRAHINALTPVTPGGNTGGNNNGGDIVLRGGDGDFRQFKVLGNPSNEDVQEGETAEVLGFEFRADDSDLLIERIDVVFGAGGTRPWRVFDEVAIYLDDDEIASMDADDEDDWTREGNSRNYRIRLSNIDEVIREDDRVRMYVVVTVKDNVDDDEYEDWTVRLDDDGIRARNAEDIYVYEGNYNQSKKFSIEEAEGGEIEISVDDNDNKDRVVSVDEDRETDDVVLYTAEIEGEDGDNLIEEVTVSIEIVDGTSTLSDIIKTLYLYIDGDEVGRESIVSGTSSTNVTFDDIDFDLDEGDEVDLQVIARIEEQDGNFQNGDSVRVTGITIDYVDERDDDKTVSSDAEGGEIKFSVGAIMIDANNTTSVAPVAGDESKGRFTVTFKITAPDNENIFIGKGATTSQVVGSGNGASFIVVDGNGNEVEATTSSANSLLTRVSGGSESGGYYRISKGNTATFRLDVIVDNNGAETERTLGIQLTGINYKVGSSGPATERYTAGIDDDFRSNTEYLLTQNVTN